MQCRVWPVKCSITQRACYAALWWHIWLMAISCHKPVSHQESSNPVTNRMGQAIEEKGRKKKVYSSRRLSS